jgi:hypothetical protein
MRRWLGIGGLVGGVVGLFGLVTGGCSNATAPYPDTGSFCESLAAAQCQSPDGGAGIPGLCGVSADTCASAAQSACLESATKALMDPTREYNQANAPACITATAEVYGNPTISASDLTQLATICNAVFAGNAAIGGKCTSTASCAQGVDGGAAAADGGGPSVVCAPVTPGSKELLCAMAVPVVAGGFCANPGDVCPTGTYCTGSPAMCEEGASVEGTCTQVKGCAAGGYCDIDEGADKGVCKVGGGIGSECSTSANCGTMAPYCDMNVTATSGSGGSGACEVGLSFAVGADDCKAFGAGK